jgi:hypothetical protein
MDAIERAFEIGAKYTSISLTIHLDIFGSGIHYIVRDSVTFYMPLLVDRFSH